MSIRNRVITACYNWDKRVLGLPSEKYSLRGVSKLEFDLNAPSFNVRRDLIAFDLALILWKRILESSGQQQAVLDSEKFLDWLRNTPAGQTVFGEALKIADQRIPRDMSYDKVCMKSVETRRHEIITKIVYMIMISGATAVTLVVALAILMLLTKLITS